MQLVINAVTAVLVFVVCASLVVRYDDKWMPILDRLAGDFADAYVKLCKRGRR